jgi:drug/metabolite transporter (DMT)-like permease
MGSEHAMLVATYRTFIAAIVLTPFYIRELRKTQTKAFNSDIAGSILPGICLALHFITWIIGARRTWAVNSSLIVNMTPVFMPLFLIMFAREVPTVFEMAGTVVAISGLALLAAGDFQINPQTFRGDSICFISMLFFALYLVLAKRSRTGSFFLYIVPLYYIAGTVCLIITLFFVNPVKPYELREVALIIGLGIIPTVMGHSILNYSMQTLRGQTVSIINLSQFIFAGILGFLILHEIPSPSLYVASALVVIGSVIAIRSHRTA